MDKDKTSQRLALAHLNPMDWARFGLQQVAYVRPAVINGAVAFGIHAADGRPIGAAPTAELAFAAIREHEMEPAQVH
jgi:hypothetical protein